MDEYVLSGDLREGVVHGTPLVQEFTLSQGLKVLPYTAFLSHTELTKIVVPAGSELTEIGEAAFANCLKLASFNFEDATKLTTIGVEALEGAAFTEITLPASLQTIANLAFNYVEELETVHFSPESQLTSIGSRAFSGNEHTREGETGANAIIGSHLQTFTVPRSVTFIGAAAFAYTSSLETFTFEEGSQLTGFANNMFQMSGIQRIENIPSTLTSIGQYTFMRTTRLTTFEMDHVASIGLSAFSNSVLQTVALRGTYETLAVRAFDGCKDLTSVTLGERVKKLDNYAFIDCSGLEEITLPASCTAIAGSVFCNCTSLKRVTLLFEGVVATETSAFTHVISGQATENLALEKVYVPASQVEHYQYDAGWTAYRDIIEAIPA